MINITDQINGHLQRNEVLKNKLQGKGVALSQSLSVELHFWAFTRQDAVLLAKALYDEGLLILTLGPISNDKEKKWNIEAGTKESVDRLTSLPEVKRYVELAARFNSVYDGWGATF